MDDRSTRESLKAQLAMCEKLAAEFSGEFTTRNIRELTEEIESQLRALQK